MTQGIKSMATADLLTMTNKNSSDKQKAINAGCNDYISKPISRLLLLEKIEQYILDIIFASRNPAEHGLEKIKD